jgi:Domain of unknown function (DUF4410)
MNERSLRRTMAVIVPCLLALVVVAGCASTKVSNRHQLVTEQLPRPNHIWVYDFAASAAEVPANSALAGEATDASESAEQMAIGRQLGTEIASQLVQEIQSMGLPAVRGGAGTTPEVNDIVIRGYLVSVKEGSAAERVAIGFGAGASQLKTAVEGFQMTAYGLRKLGSGTVDAGGGKTPGAALGVIGLAATANPAGLIISTGMKVYGEASGSSKVQGRAKATAKEIATVLEKRFQQEGWI